MPKTTNDWIGMILKTWALVSLIGTGIARVMPLTWIEGKSAWLVMLCLSTFFLMLWAIERYLDRQIFTPIRELAEAISKLEKASIELTCTVGSQHNRIEELIGKTRGMQDYMYKTLKDLAPKIQNNLPEQGASKKSVENSK